MKKTAIIFTILAFGSLFSQKRPVKLPKPPKPAKVDETIFFRKISDEILLNGTAYEDLRELTKDIGQRFSGSENYEKAVVWAQKKFQKAGADKVWLQEVKVPIWERGLETLSVKTSTGKWQELRLLSLGNTNGTGGKDLIGEILYVKSIEDFKQIPSEDVKDKIVFFNYPFDQRMISPVDAYGEAGKYRYSTATLAGKRGAKAVIIRSLTSAFDDVPHTGSTTYDPDDKFKIPAVAIGAKSADELAKILVKQKMTAKLNSNCGMNGEMTTNSVIAELTGNTDKSVIVVAAHLDSWDLGEGAHDDGAGVVQLFEVLKTYKKLEVANRHTIRFICFANEENGVMGGKTYADYVKKKHERHIFAIESDAGGFSPRGISLDMMPQKRRQIFDWKKYFLPYGVYNFDETYSGVDIAPLKTLDVPLAEIVPDMQRYFDIHHTAEDTFEKVNRRELLLGAVTMAQIVYLIDKYW